MARYDTKDSAWKPSMTSKSTCKPHLTQKIFIRSKRNMKNSITQSEAEALIEKYITSPHLKLHSLETEAVMRGLARHFGEDEELRGLT